jgi:excisionase family DNA binding protein
MEMSVNLSDYLTTGQVARLLGVSPVRVIQLANARRLPCVRLGNGMRLFHPDDVRAEQERRTNNYIDAA